MGIDDEWMEQEGRGWQDPKKWVCQHCVREDSYLRHLVRVNLATTACSYCCSPKRKAAPLSVLMDALLRGVKYSYNDEANAGCPYDSECPIDYMSSDDVLQDVLHSQDLEWTGALVADVAKAFTNTGWVEAPDGDWMGSYHHERLHWSWTSFADAVKHRSRFHFQANNRVRRHGDDLVGVHEMLPFLGQLVRQHRMVCTLPTATVLHRVRLGTHPHCVAEQGSPPKEKASAGRMNPVGIPYLYLAYDENTALAEARAKQGDQVTISQWLPVRDLHVIDLSYCPKCPSVFSDKRRKHDVVQFLYKFRDEICKPVDHDDKKEHIEYVPTQVVSEYFSQAFAFAEGKRVDGIIYPSALEVDGKNLVLFPKHGEAVASRAGEWFGVVALKASKSGRVCYGRHSII